MNNCNFGVTKQVKVQEYESSNPIDELFYLLRGTTEEEKMLLLDELGFLDLLKLFKTTFLNLLVQSVNALKEENKLHKQVFLTESEYQELVDEDKVEQDTIYFTTEDI